MNNEITKEVIYNLIEELNKFKKHNELDPIHLTFIMNGRKFVFFELEEKYYKYTPEPITPQSRK